MTPVGGAVPTGTVLSSREGAEVFYPAEASMSDETVDWLWIRISNTIYGYDPYNSADANKLAYYPRYEEVA